MGEHKWLTEKEVEEYSDAGQFDRFVADWLEMRKLAEELLGRNWFSWSAPFPGLHDGRGLYVQCKRCTGGGKTAETIVHTSNCIVGRTMAMLEATADE